MKIETNCFQCRLGMLLTKANRPRTFGSGAGGRVMWFRSERASCQRRAALRAGRLAAAFFAGAALRVLRVAFPVALAPLPSEA